MANLFARKPLDRLMQEAQEVGEHSLKRSLGPWNLIALGIGGIIGAGLFVRTAAAIAERAGPSVVLAFMVAGVGCGNSVNALSSAGAAGTSGGGTGGYTGPNLGQGGDGKIPVGTAQCSDGISLP